MHNMNGLVNCKLCYMLDKMQILGYGQSLWKISWTMSSTIEGVPKP
jgi:hypothetical protein